MVALVNLVADWLMTHPILNEHYLMEIRNMYMGNDSASNGGFIRSRIQDTAVAIVWDNSITGSFGVSVGRFYPTDPDFLIKLEEYLTTIIPGL